MGDNGSLPAGFRDLLSGMLREARVTIHPQRTALGGIRAEPSVGSLPSPLSIDGKPYVIEDEVYKLYEPSPNRQQRAAVEAQVEMFERQARMGEEEPTFCPNGCYWDCNCI